MNPASWLLPIPILLSDLPYRFLMAFELWTGAEYTAAAGMLFVGMEQQANQAIKDVRNRYDGYKRNPFNEEECGNHYVRAMASWSEILALSQFNYSGVDKDFFYYVETG